MIMVIDDDPAIRDALHLAFDDRYEIQSHSSGPRGLAALSEEIHAVILDIKMHGQDGFWTYKAIRQRFTATPIIFFSAFQDLKDPYEIINEYRPFGYVRKGQELTDLQAMVGRAVDEYAAHRRKEAQLRIADRLAALGTLAAGAAHEINNPLSYVVGNLEYVCEKLLEGAEVRDYCKRFEVDRALFDALDGTTRITRIVKDLRSFGRLDGDELELGDYDVHETIELALKMAASEIRHRARVVRDFSDVPLVIADSGRLCQIFLNLLVNAAQALPMGQAEHNEIRIRTSVNGSDRVAIEIHDTGPGIPDDIKGRIFDPFFTTKPVDTGTGLGLFVTHSLARALNGSIHLIESSQEHGTTFRVQLPASEVSRDQMSEASITASSRIGQTTPSRRILVVDDEPLIGALLRRALLPHDVTYIDNGRAAVELCSREEFDIILCDVMMPDCTGIEVYRQLEAAPAKANGRVVFMTGGLFDPEIARRLDELQRPCLQKPIQQATLLQLLADGPP